ncbi:MAG: adenosylcobinamide-GDP ribazoletransferase [Deltaproteobacteria bacterium]|nr:adenosylcobinamide-GDP ribazoletransferase [Deltaproteobacteria bacterium]
MIKFRNRFHLKGLGTALRTLTAIPWPGRKSEDFAASLPWFPFIGLLLGAILYGLSLLWGLLPFTPWPAGTAMLLVAVDICLTRGLHFDGLADWADSIGGFLEREKRLSIMKDVSLGTFGVMALIIVVLSKWIAFERLISCGTAVWLIAALILSRDMMVELMTTLPYARSGEGMGRPFVMQASTWHRVVSHVATVAVSIPLGPFFLLLFCIGGLETRLFGIRCRHQFGGITGDLLGTANEMVEVTLLMMCALLGKGLLSYTGWGWIF